METLGCIFNDFRMIKLWGKHMKIDFSDYKVITEHSINKCDQYGITYQDSNGIQFIDFKTCAENFNEEHPGASKNCIGERWACDVNPNISLYTAPLTTHIYFMRSNRIKEFLSRKNAYQRFNDFNKTLNKMGWKTYDMS